MESNLVIVNKSKKRAELTASEKTKKAVSLTIKILMYVFLSIWAFIALFPIIWSMYSSFKVSDQIVANAIALPNAQSFTLANFKEIFSQSIDIGMAYFNSIYVTIITVFFTILVSYLMAFALVRFKFRFKNALSVLIVACMMFPAFSLMLPLYRLFDRIQLINTHFAVIVLQIALNMSFSTILLRGFLSSLPIEVEESAFIDGAGIIRTMFTIVLPMMKSAIATAVIFVFLWSYNDLFLQTFLLRTADKRMIPYLLVTVTSMKGTNFGKMAAAATMVAVPMLVVYFILQKNIIKGLTAGAIKG